MRRIAVSFVVAACWVMCSLAPAWAQSSQERDLYDCEDFRYQEDAQNVYDRHPGDPYGLDGPIGPASAGTPGVACEDLPHRPTSADDQYSPETPVDTPTPSCPTPTPASHYRTRAGLLTSPSAPCCSWLRPWWRAAAS
jgi:hypothetical protein